MSQTFRSLADILRSAKAVQVAPQSQPSAPADTTAAAANVRSSLRSDDLKHACASLAVVRLAAKEAYLRSARRLLESLAHDVLVRELALDGVDVEALVQCSLEAFAADEPVGLVLCGADAERVSCDLPIRIDAALGEGDLVVSVRDGSIDATLTVRVGAAIDEALA